MVGAVSSPADAVEAARFIYEQIAQIMIERRIEIVHERIFGSLSVESAVHQLGRMYSGSMQSQTIPRSPISKELRPGVKESQESSSMRFHQQRMEDISGQSWTEISPVAAAGEKTAEHI